MYFNKLDCKMYIILFNIFVKTSCKNLHAFLKCRQNSPGERKLHFMFTLYKYYYYYYFYYYYPPASHDGKADIVLAVYVRVSVCAKIIFKTTDQKLM